ncbi:PREDICTED: fas-activated serine/threonine kinase [Gekko japonicus]|uniref:Fas-activated serine/threonine kinase n=1 Tax=Gekko japonicus TaxID=146911 RepID=A0ABM1JRM2_GEKJA|nr:PREDICTED: fas-activated serine/threonine kinase [Gekko japonicus]
MCKVYLQPGLPFGSLLQVIQKLVFPFSRTNYRPSNHLELFPQLESVLVQKATASPLATVNILMSLVQLRHFPLAVLHKVFSPSFLDSVTSSPCGLIVRRYLSLLDAAVALEVQGYDGPRLGPQYRVCMFDGALTADEANHKYSYKGLVAEALRQLVGEEGYRQDAVVPPGYCADILLEVSRSGSVLPWTPQAAAPLDVPDLQALASDTPSGSLTRQPGPGSPSAGRLLLPEGSPCPLAPRGCGGRLREDPGPGPAGSPAEAAPRSTAPLLVPEPRQQDLPEERRRLPAAPVATPGAVPGGMEAAEEIHRIVLSVNDKWHYCQNSAVLVGSRAMRDRHLLLLGYHLLQVRGRVLVEGKRLMLLRLRGLPLVRQGASGQARPVAKGQSPPPPRGLLKAPPRSR